jgi:hypothetical protein
MLTVILVGLVCFGLGVLLSDFIKHQILKLERKNR